MACNIFKEETRRSYDTAVYVTFPRAGQRETVVNRTINRVDFLLCQFGSPVGNANATIRRTSDDSIMQTSPTVLDVSTITVCTTRTWYAFLFNQLVNEEVRFLFEYAGGDGSNNVKLSYFAFDTIPGQFTRYAAGIGYTDYPAYDCTIKVWETEAPPPEQPGARWPLYKYLTLTV